LERQNESYPIYLLWGLLCILIPATLLLHYKHLAGCRANLDFPENRRNERFDLIEQRVCYTILFDSFFSRNDMGMGAFSVPEIS
jgi:hypothetical protein